MSLTRKRNRMRSTLTSYLYQILESAAHWVFMDGGFDLSVVINGASLITSMIPIHVHHRGSSLNHILRRRRSTIAIISHGVHGVFPRTWALES